VQAAHSYLHVLLPTLLHCLITEYLYICFFRSLFASQSKCQSSSLTHGSSCASRFDSTELPNRRIGLLMDFFQRFIYLPPKTKTSSCPRSHKFMRMCLFVFTNVTIDSSYLHNQRTLMYLLYWFI
jgi:hypothetical protein